MLSTSLLVLSAAGLSAAYTWPNPQMERFDVLRYEQFGVGADFGLFVKPCNIYNFGTKTGRTNSADWLRTVRSPSVIERGLDWPCEGLSRYGDA